MTVNTEPHIVVADGLTTVRDDLNWQALKELGRLQVYDRCGPELVQRCQSADIVLTNKEVFDAATLEQLPRLKFISVLATGTNVIDIPAAERAGVSVSNVPSYSTESVTQHVFSLLFAINNRVAENNTFCRSGKWSASGQFSAPQFPITELGGKTFAIVGLGHIGRRVAAVARALGMRVIASPSHRPDAKALEGVERVSWVELWRDADVVSLHCPLTADTQGLLGAEQLRQMKPSAIVINTGRGPLIDEAALAEALDAGQLRGAGLDVLSVEPPAADHPLLQANNCIVTPHLAWASVEARQRLLAVSVENVRAFLAGNPQNLVTER